MTTINDIADLLRIIREQPEWADALRGALLGQELLELPQRFAEFAVIVDRRFAALESDVADLKSDVADLKVDVAELKSDVAGLKVDVSEIKGDIVSIKGDINRQNGEMRRMSGEIGNLRGMVYEQRIGNNIHSIIRQHLNIRKIRVLKGYKAFDEMPFFDLIDDAEGRGIIDQQQRMDAGNVDIVLQGQSHPEESVVYVAVEVSVTVANSDITRAGDRADTLRQVTGYLTLPVVIGVNINEAQREFAAERGVALIVIAE